MIIWQGYKNYKTDFFGIFYDKQMKNLTSDKTKYPMRGFFIENKLKLFLFKKFSNQFSNVI